MKRSSVQELVESLLTKNAELRDSDLKLYITIAELKGCADVPIRDLLVNLKSWDMPPFETVRRTRQRIQAMNPRLRGSDLVDAWRRYREMQEYELGRMYK